MNDNPQHSHSAALRATASPLARAFHKQAARMLFPNTPQLWELTPGPWTTIILQMARWYEDGASIATAEVAADTYLARTRAYWDSRVDAPVSRTTRADNTLAVLEFLKSKETPAND